MSREEVEGGGKRKRAGGRGQAFHPQSEGTLKRLQMEGKGQRRANSVQLPGNVAPCGRSC